MFGYIDPGSGALIWQFLAAACFSSLFFLKKIFSFFRMKPSRKKEEKKSGNAE